MSIHPLTGIGDLPTQATVCVNSNDGKYPSLILHKFSCAQAVYKLYAKGQRSKTMGLVNITIEYGNGV